MAITKLKSGSVAEQFTAEAPDASRPRSYATNDNRLPWRYRPSCCARSTASRSRNAAAGRT
jgi:hypothetical protein